MLFPLNSIDGSRLALTFNLTHWFYLKKQGLRIFGAGNEIRTRDPNLGKVVLYHWAIPAEVVCIIGRIFFPSIFVLIFLEKKLFVWLNRSIRGIQIDTHWPNRQHTSNIQQYFTQKQKRDTKQGLFKQ